MSIESLKQTPRRPSLATEDSLMFLALKMWKMWKRVVLMSLAFTILISVLLVHNTKHQWHTIEIDSRAAAKHLKQEQLLPEEKKKKSQEILTQTNKTIEIDTGTSIQHLNQEQLLPEERTTKSQDILTQTNKTYYMKKLNLEHPLQYAPPPSVNIKAPGVQFKITNEQLELLHIPMTNFSVLDMETVTDFSFVTACSANHFIESREAVGRIQKYMPEKEILYYDLGLSSEQIKQIKAFCNVKYRKFDDSKYPSHVKHRRNYAFKPLVIHDALLTHRAVIWMDASFRLQSDLSDIYPQILETGGYLALWGAPHTNYGVTNPIMYQYLVTDIEKQKTIISVNANVGYWHKTEKVYRDILYWWVLCALDINCMAPKGSHISCHGGKWPLSVYFKCHRFDMSALNMLLTNEYNFNRTMYLARNVLSVSSVERNKKYVNPVKICT